MLGNGVLWSEEANTCHNQRRRAAGILVELALGLEEEGENQAVAEILASTLVVWWSSLVLKVDGSHMTIWAV